MPAPFDGVKLILFGGLELILSCASGPPSQIPGRSSVTPARKVARTQAAPAQGGRRSAPARPGLPARERTLSRGALCRPRPSNFVSFAGFAIRSSFRGDGCRARRLVRLCRQANRKAPNLGTRFALLRACRAAIRSVDKGAFSSPHGRHVGSAYASAGPRPRHDLPRCRFPP